MHDSLRVAVVQRHQDLSKCFGCEHLCEVFVLNNSVEEFATLAKLLHQIYILVIFKVLEQLYNVGMVLKFIRLN